MLLQLVKTIGVVAWRSVISILWLNDLGFDLLTFLLIPKCEKNSAVNSMIIFTF